MTAEEEEGRSPLPALLQVGRGWFGWLPLEIEVGMGDRPVSRASEASDRCGVPFESATFTVFVKISSCVELQRTTFHVTLPSLCRSPHLLSRSSASASHPLTFPAYSRFYSPLNPFSLTRSPLPSARAIKARPLPPSSLFWSNRV